MRTARLTTILAAGTLLLATLPGGSAAAQSEPPPDSPDDRTGEPGDSPDDVPADADDGDLSSGGVGIAPAFLTIDEALRGNSYTASLILTNGIAGDREFTLTPGGDIGDWLSFADVDGTELTSIVVPQGETTTLEVRVAVDAETANGLYEGVVEIESLLIDDAVSEGDGSGAAVSFGAEVPITLQVGGEMRQAATLDFVQVGGAEIGVPVELIASFNNTGNVSFDPVVDFTIIRNEQTVDVITIAGDQTVDAGQAGDVKAVWDTTDALPGDYVVEVAAFADGYEFDDVSEAFRVEATGSIERVGRLDSLELVNLPQAGTLARVRGMFVNASPVPTDAILVAEVTRDGVLVGEVRSLNVLTPPNQTTSLDVTIDDVEIGEYIIRGKVNYEGRETGTMETSFVVTASGFPDDGSLQGNDDSNGLTLWLIVVALVGLVIGPAALFLVLRNRKGGSAVDGSRPGPHGPTSGSPHEVQVAQNDLPADQLVTSSAGTDRGSE